MNPMVSVILPYFNGSKLIQNSVNSVLTQSYPNFELLIVDDGSDPADASCLRYFDDPRIRLHRQQNAGVSVARNSGIEKAHGEWLAFIDQDDHWQPQKLERQIHYLQSNPECNALHTAVRRQRGDGSWAEYHKKPLTLVDFLWTSPNPAYLSSTLIRRQSLYRAGLFHPGLRFSQDHECFLRCARLFPFHYIDEVLVTRIEHGENLSADKPGCWREAVEIIRLHQDAYADHQAFRKCLYTVHLENGHLALQARKWQWLFGILKELGQEEFSRLGYLKHLATGHRGYRMEFQPTA
jgi:glycosyltransferase involved in cell wall biosynthesis